MFRSARHKTTNRITTGIGSRVGGRGRGGGGEGRGGVLKQSSKCHESKNQQDTGEKKKFIAKNPTIRKYRFQSENKDNEKIKKSLQKISFVSLKGGRDYVYGRRVGDERWEWKKKGMLAPSESEIISGGE